jgi:hypothetical protein
MHSGKHDSTQPEPHAVTPRKDATSRERIAERASLLSVGENPSMQSLAVSARPYPRAPECFLIV